MSNESVQVKTYPNNEVEVSVVVPENGADQFVYGMQQALFSLGIRSLAVRKLKCDDKTSSFLVSRTNKEDFDS